MEKVARDVCLRRQLEQMLSDMIKVQEQSARERLLALLGYYPTARTERADDGTGLEGEV